MPKDGETFPLRSESQELARNVQDETASTSWNPAGDGNMEDIKTKSQEIESLEKELQEIAKTKCDLVCLPYSPDRQILTIFKTGPIRCQRGGPKGGKIQFDGSSAIFFVPIESYCLFIQKEITCEVAEGNIVFYIL
jgi:hypothetical protein